MLTETDRPLVTLLDRLRDRDYRFVTPTPATHARVVARPDRREAHDLAGVLGWSLPYRAGTIDQEIEALLDAAGMIERRGDGRVASRVRVSSLNEHLFLHSAYPTDESDAVFFGPDSYRFADFIDSSLDCAPGARVVDIGTGAGVGALVAAEACLGVRLTMTDINPKALRFAAINTAHAGVEAEFLETNGLEGVEGPVDVALANPPYIIDAKGRAYRDGGDMHGGRIALDMACAAAERLGPGGQLLLYTGSAIIDGRDPLCAALAEAMADRDCDFRWRELDPDVFGEELDGEAYADVERIAAIGAVATKRRGAKHAPGA